MLLQDPNQLVLYVNDEHNQPLDVRQLTGRWTLNPDSPTPSTGPFAPTADGTYFLTMLPALTTELIHVAVAVLKDGEWAEMEFSLPAPQSAEPKDLSRPRAVP